MSKRVYILDPGHGGIDTKTGKYVTSGKRSPIWSDGKQYFEGVGNREIVKLIAEGLEKLNISYSFTVCPNDFNDVSLSQRCYLTHLAIKKKNKPGVLISIHSNGHSNEAANGFEVFTSPGQTTSDKFADVLFKSFKDEFPELKQRTDTSDGDFDKEAKFKVLTGTRCPAILLESMFHTNERECRILMSKEGQQRIANSVIKAIQEMELI